MTKCIVLTVATAAGVVMLATSATAKDRRNTNEITCPDIPTTNDVDRAREGGASLQIAGFGVNGNKSRTHSVKDVMMREGQFEAWSAASIFAKACQDLRTQYPLDHQRQLQELLKLRDKLLSPVAAQPFEPVPAIIFNVSATGGQHHTTGSKKLFNAPYRQPSANTDDRGVVDAATHSRKRSYAAPTITTICAGNGCIQTDQKMATRVCTVSQSNIFHVSPLQIGNLTISSMPNTIGGSETSCTTSFGF